MRRPVVSAVESFVSWFVDQVLVGQVPGHANLVALDAFLSELEAKGAHAFFDQPMANAPQWRWQREVRQYEQGALIDFAFDSAMPSGCVDNDLVRGRALLHKSRERSPHVILLHGWITPTHHQSMRVARALLAHGISTYMLELPYHMRRKPSGRFSGLHLLDRDLRVFPRAMQQGISDVRQLIALLRQRSLASISLAGISMGAYVSGVVSSLEPDLDTMSLVMPMVDLHDTFFRAPILAESRKFLQGLGLERETLDAYFKPFRLTHFQPLLPRERVLLINAAYDRIVFPQHVKSLWQAWERPTLWEVPHSHVSLFFAWSPFVRLVRHLRQQLVEGSPQLPPYHSVHSFSTV